MRIHRLIVRAGIIACGVMLFGILFAALRTAFVAHPDAITGEKDQNGWTLVQQFDGSMQRITEPNAFLSFFRSLFGRRAEQDSTYWPQYPALAVSAPEGDGRPDGNMTRVGVTAEGMSSTGDRFQLDSENPDPTNNYGRDVYVRIPVVPATYRWINVTVSDKAGRRATWRLSNLPRLIHQDLGPTDAGVQSPIEGVELEGRAYWDVNAGPVTPNGWSGPEEQYVPVVAEIRFHNSKLQDPSLRWSLDNSKMRQEWERPVDPFVIGLEYFRTEGAFATGSEDDERIVGFAAPNPRVQHEVGVDIKLAEHKTATETVTFHNLHFSRMGDGWSLDPDAASTARSPSGIVVRLMPAPARAVGHRPLSTYTIEKDHIYYRFKIEQYGSNKTLPGSPLYRRYHHPVDISGTVAYDDAVDGYYGQSGTEEGQIEGGMHFKSLPASHILPTLKFDVFQDTVVRDMPIRFVLPVTQGKPKDAWNKPEPQPQTTSNGNCGCAK